MDLYGRKVGIVSGPRAYTYAEFGDAANGWRRAALEGVRAGGPRRLPELQQPSVAGRYFGVPLTRAIVMPLNVRLTPAELRHPEPRRGEGRSSTRTISRRWWSSCAHLPRGPTLDRSRATPYEELLSRGRIARPDMFTFDENAIAELFYTSGSTGTPKGVTLSHRTLYLHALGVAATF